MAEWNARFKLHGGARSRPCGEHGTVHEDLLGGAVATGVLPPGVQPADGTSRRTVLCDTRSGSVGPLMPSTSRSARRAGQPSPTPGRVIPAKVLITAASSSRPKPALLALANIA